MTVHLDISFETLVELIKQLPIEKQQVLLHQIKEDSQPNSVQDANEKLKKLRSARIDLDVTQEPSSRREDWYSDEG